ncbi:hypothetical protein ABB28_12120 [Stenotrophomonas chelatiphaga]|uniref:Uncharacterized protein n=1 Tax=Stenotrophomonas chelatiphaga TaxID=517011 RepID=A0A0R0CVB4_9GAMM|nr:hypothetical protein ABB28_12120 [Stenotrophomonas chelatiphaga]
MGWGPASRKGVGDGNQAAYRADQMGAMGDNASRQSQHMRLAYRVMKALSRLGLRGVGEG